MLDRKLVDRVTEILSDMKGDNIVAFDISEASSIADYMVICTGNSGTHVFAMADTLHQKMKDAGEPASARDGQKGSQWMCMDFGSVIVHVMGAVERDFYSIESIWGECENIYIEPEVNKNI